MDEKREILNPYDDYAAHRDNTALNIKDGKIQQEFVETLQTAVTTLLAKLDADLDDVDQRDYSIYTGSSGIALLYFLISQKQQNPSYLKKSVDLVEKALPRLKNHRVSFLNGDPGPLTLGAVLYHINGSAERSQELIGRVKSFMPEILNLKSELPDEVLYGRTGYLYALLFLNKHIGEGTIESNIIQQLVSAVLRSGQNLARHEGRSVPLMYTWHGKHYLGGAHGISGILYLLLQAKSYLSRTELDTLVRPTIDYVQGTQFPSGNFPSSLSNNTDKLVQWCHGAPGAVYLFCEAYKVFGDERYLKTALECGEVVWKRGLLKKGYSICHGVAGNGYTFLLLYQVTGDLKHLHRACKFAEWCTSYGKHQGWKPDRPLSLFEGLAGAIYFLVDIQEPQTAKFPAFTL